MALAPLPEVTVTPVTHLPEKYFLENLVVRADGSVLITALLSKELWLVPAPARELGEPVLLHRFDHLTTGIVEVEPDVFVVSLSELYTTHESHLVRIDLNGWTPGTPVNPEIIYTFDERVRALNGSCAFGPSSMLLADCFAGLIWRVDLSDHAHKATADVWISHDTMWHDPDSEVPPPLQPGVNGVRYGAKTGYVYYTSTAQKVFMRVRVDPKTLDPTGPPEFIAAIDNDPALQGKISYRCMKSRDGSDYYHLAAAADDQAIKALQASSVFKNYTEKTRKAAGGSVDVLPLDIIAETKLKA